MWAHIASGETIRGQGWENYPIGSSDANSKGVTIKVDTSAAKFDGTPRYFTSIGGKSRHWVLVGPTSIYEATKNSFRVYVRYANGGNLNAKTAKELEWYINWFAIQDETSNNGLPPPD